MSDAPSRTVRTNTTTTLIQRGDGALLLVREGDGWTLPVVETSGHWHAEPGPVNSAIEQRYGVRATALRMLSHGLDSASNHADQVVVMELRAPVGDTPTVQWASIDDAIAAATPEQRDAIVAWREGRARGGNTPWSKLGWLDETIGWCRDRLTEHGISLAGAPEQSKHWSIASIWRLPTDRGDVWLKAVPDFFAHEGAVLQLIAPSMPDQLPHVIAADRARGLLLMEPFPGETLWGSHDGAAHDRAARTLASLQQRWAGRVDGLLGAGCVDRRLHTLDGALEAVLAREAVRAWFTEDEIERLMAYGRTVPARIDALRACGVPDTLMHGDFHPGNVAVDADRPIIFDWTDACVSHPFFDLATYNPRDPVEHAAVTQAFIEGWSGTLEHEALQRAAELAQPLACIHHATSYMRLLDCIHGGDHWELDNDVMFWLHWLRALID